MNTVLRCNFFVEKFCSRAFVFFLCFRQNEFFAEGLKLSTRIPETQTYQQQFVTANTQSQPRPFVIGWKTAFIQRTILTNEHKNTKCFLLFFSVMFYANKLEKIPSLWHTQRTTKKRDKTMVRLRNENMHTNLLVGKNVSRLFWMYPL